HAAGDVLGAAVAALEAEALAREQRGQVLEQHLALGRLRRLAVDGVHDVERDVALAILRAADAAGDVVAGAQVEAADLAGRDVDVVRAGQVAGVGRAQEAVAVRQDFQHAVAGDALWMPGQDLEQGEGDVLLAHARHAFVQAQLLGDLQQLVRRHALEVVEAVDGEVRRQLRHRPLLAAAIAVLALAAAFTVAVAVAEALVAEAFAAVAPATFAEAALAAIAAFVAALGLLAAFLAAAGVTAGRGLGGPFGRGRAGRGGLRGGGLAGIVGTGRGTRLARALLGVVARLEIVFGHGIHLASASVWGKRGLAEGGAMGTRVAPTLSLPAGGPQGRRNGPGAGRARGAPQSALSTNWASWALPTAPTWVECTLPSLNSMSVGMPRTAYWRGVCGLWSMFSFTTLTLPA